MLRLWVTMLDAVYWTLFYVLIRLYIVDEKIIKKNKVEDWVKTCDAQLKEEYKNKQLEMEAIHRVQLHEMDIELNKQMSEGLALANKLAKTEENFAEFVVRHAAETKELGSLNMDNQPHGASFHQNNILNADSSNEFPACLTSGDCNIAGDGNDKGSTASPNSPDRQLTPTKIPRQPSVDHNIVKLADDDNVKGSTASPTSPDRQLTPTKIPHDVRQPSGDQNIVNIADGGNVRGSTTSPNCPDSLLSTDRSKASIPSSIPSNTLKFQAHGELLPAVSTTKVADMEDTVFKLSIQERPRFNRPKMQTQNTYKKVQIPCSEGAACMRHGCEFTHLSDKPASKKVQCRFGAACRRADCVFQHEYY